MKDETWNMDIVALYTFAFFYVFAFFVFLGALFMLQYMWLFTIAGVASGIICIVMMRNRRMKRDEGFQTKT